jgi:hypothetical protein
MLDFPEREGFFHEEGVYSIEGSPYGTAFRTMKPLALDSPFTAWLDNPVVQSRIWAARCSGQLKAQYAFSPPSAVRRSPVSVSCLVSSSKLVFISVRTWRATGASSCTAFSNWASLSFRLAEPPCVPSRTSSKWRIRLVIYAGIALSGIA